MNIVLSQTYGELQKGSIQMVKYKVIDEGYDWYYLSNGYYIPKIYCRSV